MRCLFVVANIVDTILATSIAPRQSYTRRAIIYANQNAGELMGLMYFIHERVISLVFRSLTLILRVFLLKSLM